MRDEVPLVVRRGPDSMAVSAKMVAGRRVVLMSDAVRR